MTLHYCFEQSYVARTLAHFKPHDLDTGGISTAAVKAACARGVQVCGYISAI